MAAAGAAAGAAALAAGGAAVCGRAGGASSAGLAVDTRLFTFSTTTALVRPWLKLWRTTPCSTLRAFSVKVFVGVTLSFFSPVFSVVSAIPIPFSDAVSAVSARRPPLVFRTTGPEALEAANARQERLAFGAGKQGCMYHI